MNRAGKNSRHFLLTGVLVLILICAFLYGSRYFYHQAGRESNEERRIQLLKKSARLVPFDDQVFYELGKAYYEIAVRSLGDSRLRSSYLTRSIHAFQRSLKCNPGAYQTHYRLAQALLFSGYLSPENPDFFSEYRKAAQLTTFDNDVYFEIGRILFSVWPELDDFQKKETLDILNNVIQSRDNQRLWRILQIWASDVLDYEVIKTLLPETPEAFRMYARFLGERSLSIEERRLKLAQAEYMEFEEAKERISRAQRDFRSYRLKQASGHYRGARRILESIQFHQRLLPGINYIDSEEYEHLLKISLLGLIQTHVLQSRTLEALRGDFDRYLELEDSTAAVEKLEDFLEENQWLELKPGTKNNPLRLYYGLRLNYEQNRYREIIASKGRAEDLEYAFRGQHKDVFSVTYRIIGDSYQKIDFLYDAVDCYQKSLLQNPENLETLVQLRNSYVRLSNDEALEDIQKRIDSLLTPEEVTFDSLRLEKNRPWSFPVKLQKDSIHLSLHVRGAVQVFAPLIAVYLNGRVVEEKYLEAVDSEAVFSATLPIDSIENNLQIKAVNQDVYLEKLKIGD
ncbi:MAG: hypothetical protein R6V02_03090 [Candidatus Aminicenantes bacterium]